MIKSFVSKLLTLALVITISFISYIDIASANLTGKYTEDTIAVLECLNTAIELPDDTDIQTKKATQNEARKQINDYISRYRKDTKYGGLKSFTTMQTALNSLAGYYTSYGNRPLPDKLKTRLSQEFKQVEFALKKGY
ncbi:MAG: photosystem II protein Psb27 [Cyanobacteria bacterium]|jgi:photosystem II Psb27 protein|uniref:photosystem II protein Psb27 n=1 Tax=Geminocystis sp. TaxID=2664100 RepID=UPI001DB830CD|nr:photosystem II protein Psb27 [Cyanobacteria bacterium CG_2015-16_32_12]NCO79094.1 photosystem II protein Psb27 [Cyanobacteria bacterium CG_2015-22_32_23]NCQ04672.1 photosystem II protein Psb27 [Cyanobacteria bacterium CG_2015-09_32_10]NCQ42808.1 photosystem II protein Psb27 [Cyanobacteria bacterium CG_2015-04_32_10]